MISGFFVSVILVELVFTQSFGLSFQQALLMS